ncbi:MAG: phosphoribosyl-ATP diphosphatase [Alphaproteobacteria bacterium]|nr:phosphoribosyl-ATP diphosphatase [Alphaproteobacteria bacterium]
METLERLADRIAARVGASPESSYTASLLGKGVEKCAKKFGEEAFELAMAAVQGDKPHITSEAADVFYHVLVLLQASGVSLDDVMAVLNAREGTSGLVEKAGRRG